MRNIQRRLSKLERLPQFEPPPGPLEEIEDRAMRQLSDEDLEVMIILERFKQRGIRHARSETERVALAAYGALRETEAQRMGFRSYAEAERIAGP
ncbi:MAG: hypothetical protein ABSB35_34830 [Bryobacteraceae bacterium]|jgi:hypothetical protein